MRKNDAQKYQTILSISVSYCVPKHYCEKDIIQIHTTIHAFKRDTKTRFCRKTCAKQRTYNATAPPLKLYTARIKMNAQQQKLLHSKWIGYMRFYIKDERYTTACVCVRLLVCELRAFVARPILQHVSAARFIKINKRNKTETICMLLRLLLLLNWSIVSP